MFRPRPLRGAEGVDAGMSRIERRRCGGRALGVRRNAASKGWR
jgi:hypothetical protein